MNFKNNRDSKPKFSRDSKSSKSVGSYGGGVRKSTRFSSRSEDDFASKRTSSKRSFSSREGSEERPRRTSSTKSYTNREERVDKSFPRKFNDKVKQDKDSKEFKTYRKRKETQIVNTHLTKVQEDGSIRINKFIAESGLCSRRKADEYIAQGVVKVNGVVVKELGVKVRASDDVTVNGDPVSYYNKNVYILLNKPKDVVTTTADELGRKTVLDIVKRRERIFPIGRLDRNTTGVLLLTNDGELSHRLSHPSYQIEKLYNVTLDKKLNFDHAKNIAEGVELEDGRTAPCFVFIEPTDHTKAKLVLHEGKYREVRRMFEHFGYIVKKLDRKEYAGLSNIGMKRGEYRFLTTKEINELKKKVGLL